MISDGLAQRLIIASREGNKHQRKTQEWFDRRDAMIIEALEQGGTQREVAKLVGLTQPAISAILNRKAE